MHPLEHESISKSYLYELLSSLGVTQSTEKTINNMRSIVHYRSSAVLNKPIMGKLYHNAHTLLPMKDISNIELWVNGEHLNPDQYKITPEENQYTSTLVPVLLDRPDAYAVKYLVNRNIVHRAHATNKIPKAGVYTYQYNYGPKVKGITAKSIYAIADNEYVSPTEVKIENETIRATFPYTKTIDIFLCKNLIWSGKTSQEETVLITDRLDPNVYGTYLLDATELADIDVRFYPFINVKSGGFLRVFSDIKTTIKPNLLPYLRFINYPEFNPVRDPYDYGWGGSSLVFSKDTIYPTDSDEVIYEKFSDIGREYYKIKSAIMPRTETFKMYDSCFVKKILALEGNRTENILYSTIPFDDYRDILFYKGKVFSDYTTATLREIDGTYVEVNPRGLPRYYISDRSYNVADFSVLKISTQNNTTIKAITADVNMNPDGKYDYLVEFDKKFRTMYKNLLALQEYKLTLTDENQVVLSEEESDVYKDYTWFQILEIDNQPQAVKALIKSGLTQNPDDPRTSIWFDMNNPDPTVLYRQLLVANIEQDPSMVGNILFALPPAELPEGTFESFSIGNDESLSKDEIFFDLNDGSAPYSLSKELMYEGNVNSPISEPKDVYLYRGNTVNNDDLLSFVGDNRPLIEEMLGGEDEYLNIIERFSIRDMTNDPLLNQLWFDYEDRVVKSRQSPNHGVIWKPDKPIELLSRIIWLGITPPEIYEGEEGVAVRFSYNIAMMGRDSTFMSEANIEIFDKNILSNLYLDYPMEHIPEYSDLFAEWIKTPLKKVIMVDGGTIVAAINDTIVRINLSSSYESEYLDLFVFDDIVLNFRKGNKTNLVYNGILPDLLNNKILDESSLIVFDGTMKDSREVEYLAFDNTHEAGNVISNNSQYTNTAELNVIYSNNIKRHTIRRLDLSEMDQAELDMKIIPINDDTIYYDAGYMAVFLNGQYIQGHNILPLTDNNTRLRVIGFTDRIDRIDFLYNDTDRPIYKLKGCLD